MYRGDNIKILINKFKEKHGENIYNYSLVEYKDSHTKIKILCPVHGMFEQTPNNHLKGQGCCKCGFNKAANIRRDNNEKFIKKAKDVHDERYNYSLVNYKDSKIKVKILCPEHGLFEQTPNNHFRGHGCPKCGYHKSNTDEFIKKAKDVHNEEYNYSLVDYKQACIKVKIICFEHGEFEQEPNNHLQGQKCPKCSIGKSYSKKQVELISLINNEYKRNFQFIESEKGEFIIPTTKYRADGYEQKTNTILEFHGNYWHGNPNMFDPDNINKTVNKTYKELYQRTIKKENKIKSLGYNLIVIWEDEWDKNPEKVMLRVKVQLESIDFNLIYPNIIFID